MPYKVRKHNSFSKGFRNLNPAFHELFLDECDNIQKNPQIGETTKGNLKKLNIKKAAIKGITPELRILYKVYKCAIKNQQKLTCEQDIQHDNKHELAACEGLVDFLICGTREMFNNFYKLPLDKLKKYL